MLTLSPAPSTKGALKRKVSKIEITISDNFKTVRDRMSVTTNH